MKYRLVLNIDGKKLEDLVNQAIEEGWKPFGSPFIGHSSFCQALTYDQGNRVPGDAEWPRILDEMVRSSSA